MTSTSSQGRLLGSMRLRARETRKGYALISVLVIGSLAVMFMLALGNTLINITQSEAYTKRKAGLINAAITGRDYIISQLCQAKRNGNALPYNLDESNPRTVIPIPNSVTNESEIQVRCCLRKLTATEKDSLSADWALLGLTSSGPNPAMFATLPYNEPISTVQMSDEFYIVEATATRGVFHQSVRSIIAPVFPTLADYEEGGPFELDRLFPASTSGGGIGAFAVSSLNLSSPRGGSLIVEAWTGSEQASDVLLNQVKTTTAPTDPKSFKLQLQSNQSARIGDNTTVIGDITVSNNLAQAPNNVVSVSDDQAQILGRVLTNSGSNTSVMSSQKPKAEQGDNVVALADEAATVNTISELSWNTERLSPNDIPTNFSAGVTPITPSPIPSPENYDNYNQLGAVLTQLSSGVGNTVDFDLSKISSTEAVSGFRVSSLNTSSDYFDPVVINENNSYPTRIYIDGGNNQTALILDSNKFQNDSDPRKLQFFYPGTGEAIINIKSGTDFNGLIYAPNATITIKGTGDFNGAVVGKDVTVKLNGKLRLLSEDQLAKQGGIGPQGLLSPSSILIAGSTERAPAVIGYKPITHQELSADLIPTN